MLANMAIPVEKLVEAALALPSDARALLADRLAESLDPLTDEQVRAAWGEEALRRRDEITSGKVAAVPADKAFAYVRTLLK
jgi:putative addiction module component (TIGR02574 family)